VNCLVRANEAVSFRGLVYPLPHPAARTSDPGWLWLHEIGPKMTVFTTSQKTFYKLEAIFLLGTKSNFQW
jgi:hypothetical protein